MEEQEEQDELKALCSKLWSIRRLTVGYMKAVHTVETYR